MERLEERMALLAAARVPFMYPGSERKGKALGLGGARVGEHVALAFWGAGFWVGGFGAIRSGRKPYWDFTSYEGILF